ncbi:putative transmembrane anti-sigma factor [Gemmatirosa kalamazoonensis]|uniref:Putative transmembrane anti-sigma factor n=1 Tax=Gemmatirosa kalamazoonensis TaxID=861299 RepID=W0RF47_9BACT|nr:zf-HC2 domain-containing protein [Gemmatirosa kalamazoonensis]AHG89421.1 putative transmembrane anti-sigma factor [Gemmatirosa kalamazoonensis]
MSHLTRLTCEEAFRRLDDFLDRELSAAETELVHEHLEICAGCAREFRFEASVLRGVRAKLRQIEVTLPAGLRDRVLRALAAEGAR